MQDMSQPGNGQKKAHIFLTKLNNSIIIFVTLVTNIIPSFLLVRGIYKGGSNTHMSQLRYWQISLRGYPNRINHVIHNPLRTLLRPITDSFAMSIPELLVQVQTATTPRQLTSVMNKLQSRTRNLPSEERAIVRKQMAGALIQLVQYASQASLRLEAAGWLRMFIQTTYMSQPEQVFVTLVTAAARTIAAANTTEPSEQHAYLKMIFDCFWPFRYPYAAYTWEQFPNNEVFYPLAPLLAQVDDSTRDALVAIFAELPSLDDAEIAEYLLPIALAWSNHTNPERRQRITPILALINQSSAQEALCRLQADLDPLVRTSAKRAIEKAYIA